MLSVPLQRLTDRKTALDIEYKHFRASFLLFYVDIFTFRIFLFQVCRILMSLERHVATLGSSHVKRHVTARLSKREEAKRIFQKFDDIFKTRVRLTR